jgi:hypothetical protein
MLDLQWIQLRKLKNKTHYIFTYWVKQQTSKSPLKISKISVISGHNCEFQDKGKRLKAGFYSDLKSLSRCRLLDN